MGFELTTIGIEVHLSTNRVTLTKYQVIGKCVNYLTLETKAVVFGSVVDLTSRDQEGKSSNMLSFFSFSAPSCVLQGFAALLACLTS